MSTRQPTHVLLPGSRGGVGRAPLRAWGQEVGGAAWDPRELPEPVASPAPDDDPFASLPPLLLPLPLDEVVASSPPSTPPDDAPELAPPPEAPELAPPSPPLPPVPLPVVLVPPHP